MYHLNGLLQFTYLYISTGTTRNCMANFNYTPPPQHICRTKFKLSCFSGVGWNGMQTLCSTTRPKWRGSRPFFIIQLILFPCQLCECIPSAVASLSQVSIEMIIIVIYIFVSICEFLAWRNLLIVLGWGCFSVQLNLGGMSLGRTRWQELGRARR